MIRRCDVDVDDFVKKQTKKKLRVCVCVWLVYCCCETTFWFAYINLESNLHYKDICRYADELCVCVCVCVMDISKTESKDPVVSMYIFYLTFLIYAFFTSDIFICVLCVFSVLHIKRKRQVFLSFVVSFYNTIDLINLRPICGLWSMWICQSNHIHNKCYTNRLSWQIVW